MSDSAYIDEESAERLAELIKQAHGGHGCTLGLPHKWGADDVWWETERERYAQRTCTVCGATKDVQFTRG